jgi:hypothetical protein
MNHSFGFYSTLLIFNRVELRFRRPQHRSNVIKILIGLISASCIFHRRHSFAPQLAPPLSRPRITRLRRFLGDYVKFASFNSPDN